MQINKYFAQETLEYFLSQCCYFYVPSKANKKKITDLFESLPFFFFDVHIQGILFHVLRDKSYVSSLDNQKDLSEYCYYVYETFSKMLNITYKPKETFFSDFHLRCFHETYKYKYIKKKYIHHAIYILIVILLCILYCLYLYDKQ